MGLVILPKHLREKEHIPTDERARRAGLLGGPATAGIVRRFYCYAHGGWVQQRVPAGVNPPKACARCVGEADAEARAYDAAGTPLGNRGDGWDTVRSGVEVRGPKNQVPGRPTSALRPLRNKLTGVRVMRAEGD